MTSKQLFEYALIELNKKEAPSLLLEDYNYFINKAVNQYINKMYNAYDINQQKTDDLRTLKSTAILTPKAFPNTYGVGDNLLNKTYEVDLPDDYLHILNCIVEYNVTSRYKCYNASDKVQFGAKRLTADMFSQVINNYYLRPTYKNPYFYINNVTTKVTYATADSQTDVLDAFGGVSKYTVTWVTLSNLVSGVSSISVTTPTQIHTFLYGTQPGQFTSYQALAQLISNIGVQVTSTPGVSVTIPRFNTSGVKQVVAVGANDPDLQIAYSPGAERIAENRYGNRSKVRMEIRYGKDNTTFALSKIYIDYLKAPQFIRLSQEEVDKVEDSSQILEFPDYVCQEVVNELVKLLMENASDPRLQTHIPINQSIATPGQETQQRR